MSFRRSFVSVLYVAFALFFLAPSAPAQNIIGVVAVHGSPSGIAVDAVRDRVYVADGPKLVVIAGSSRKIMAYIPLHAPASFVAVNAETGNVYTAGCDFGGTYRCAVSVVNPAKSHVLATIPTGTATAIGLQGLAVNPYSRRFYVADADSGRVLVFSMDTFARVGAIAFPGQQPLGVAVDVMRNRIYAVINGNQLAAIDGRSNVVLKRVTVGLSNANVAVDYVTGRVYVTNETFGPSTVGVIDGATLTVIKNISTGNNPFSVAVNQLDHRAFVTNIGGSTLSVIGANKVNLLTSIYSPGQYVDVDPVRKLVYLCDTHGMVIVVKEPS